MSIEYTIQKRIKPDGEWEEYSTYYYTDFAKAESGMYDAMDHARSPVEVSSSSAAYVAADRLKEAENTEWRVAKREVTEWQEANSWEEK